MTGQSSSESSSSSSSHSRPEEKTATTSSSGVSEHQPVWIVTGVDPSASTHSKPASPALIDGASPVYTSTVMNTGHQHVTYAARSPPVVAVKSSANASSIHPTPVNVVSSTTPRVQYTPTTATVLQTPRTLTAARSGATVVQTTPPYSALPQGGGTAATRIVAPPPPRLEQRTSPPLYHTRSASEYIQPRGRSCVLAERPRHFVPPPAVSTTGVSHLHQPSHSMVMSKTSPAGSPNPSFYPRPFSTSPLADMTRVQMRSTSDAVHSKSRPKLRRGFSVSTLSSSSSISRNWDVKMRYLPATRTGPVPLPYHIRAEHPNFLQHNSVGISPYTLYYYDETAPNDVLLANDTPEKRRQNCCQCGEGQQQPVKGGLPVDTSTSSSSSSSSGSSFSSSGQNLVYQKAPSGIPSSTTTKYSTVQKPRGKACCGCGGGPSRRVSAPSVTTFSPHLSRDVPVTTTISSPSSFPVPYTTAQKNLAPTESSSSSSSSSSSTSSTTTSFSTSHRQLTASVVPAPHKKKNKGGCCGRGRSLSADSTERYYYSTPRNPPLSSRKPTAVTVSSVSRHPQQLVSVPDTNQYITYKQQSSIPRDVMTYSGSGKTAWTPPVVVQHVNHGAVPPPMHQKSLAPTFPPTRPSFYQTSPQPQPVYRMRTSPSKTTSSSSSSSSSSSRTTVQWPLSGRTSTAPMSARQQKSKSGCCGCSTVPNEPVENAVVYYPRKATEGACTFTSASSPSSRSTSQYPAERVVTPHSARPSVAPTKKQRGGCCGGQTSPSPRPYETFSYGSSVSTSTPTSSSSSSSSSATAVHPQKSLTTTSHHYTYPDRAASYQSSVGAAGCCGRRKRHSTAGTASFPHSRASFMSSKSRTTRTGRSMTGQMQPGYPSFVQSSRGGGYSSSLSSSQLPTGRQRRESVGSPVCCTSNRRKKDLSYEIRKYYFEADKIAKQLERTLHHKKLPQYSVSYRNYPYVCFDTITPNNPHDFFQPRTAPKFYV